MSVMKLFETKSLIIRYFQPSDVSAFHAYRSLEKVARFQGYEPMNYQEAEDFVDTQSHLKINTEGSWMQVAVELKSAQLLIGDFGLCIDDQIAETGFSFHPDHQGKGYATEALLGMICFLFEKVGVRRIVETVEERNSACIRLLERCGFEKEGHFRENVFMKGEWCSELQYALLKSNWQK